MDWIVCTFCMSGNLWAVGQDTNWDKNRFLFFVSWCSKLGSVSFFFLLKQITSILAKCSVFRSMLCFHILLGLQWEITRASVLLLSAFVFWSWVKFSQVEKCWEEFGFQQLFVWKQKKFPSPVSKRSYWEGQFIVEVAVNALTVVQRDACTVWVFKTRHAAFALLDKQAVTISLSCLVPWLGSCACVLSLSYWSGNCWMVVGKLGQIQIC